MYVVACRSSAPLETRAVAPGVPQRQVARQLGLGRSTVARTVGSVVPPKYEQAVWSRLPDADPGCRLEPHLVGGADIERGVELVEVPHDLVAAELVR